MSQATELIARQMAAGSANARVWADILYNVKLYGAKGDWNGTTGTDDTVSVQATIDATIAAGGKAVFFPHGTYKVTALTNLSSVVLFGDNASFSGITDIINQIGKPSSNLVYNVKDYGAKGDGVTDDAGAFAKATQQITKSGTLEIPQGDYYFSSTWNIFNINIRIKGDGESNTRLIFAPGVNGIVYSSNDTSNIVEIRDLTMLTNGLGGADAITVTMPTFPADAGFGLLIENVYIAGEDGYANNKFSFTKYWRIGVKCTETWHTVINNLHFLGSATVGQSQSGLQFNAKSIETHLNDVTVYGAQRAIEYLGQCEGVNIDKAVIVNCLIGIYMDGDTYSISPPGTEITNSHISTYDGWIYMKGRSQLNISDLLCYRAGGALENANFVGMHIAQGVNVGNNIINIHDCSMLNLGTKALEFAVRIYNSNYCSVKDNFLSDFGTGVKLEANANITHVKNNMFVGCTNEIINLGIDTNLGSESTRVPTLLNSWVDFGSGFQPAGYYKDSSGVVHLQGTVKSGIGTTIFALPAGYRPLLTIPYEVGSNRIDVLPDGSVNYVSGANTFLNLNQISFKPTI